MTPQSIITIVFFVLIAGLALISLMTAYVFIRYGQNKGITLIVSLVFGAVFLLGTITAFVTLQQLF
jgi:hypothetical protein